MIDAILTFAIRQRWLMVLFALGTGARHGILIRDAEALEVASSVTAVVFDKTGTLTESRPAVGTIIAVDGDDAALLRRVASDTDGEVAHWAHLRIHGIDSDMMVIACRSTPLRPSYSAHRALI